MKIIKVPYTRKVQSKLDIVIQLFALSGIALMIVSIFNLDWITFLVGVIIGIPTSFFLWKTMTLQLLIWTTDFVSIKGVTDIDEKGFILNNNKESTRVLWSEVKYFRLDLEENLVVEQINGKQIKIDQKYNNWYLLLKQIPSSKQEDLKIPELIRKTFNNLKTCQVCGSIALQKEKCLSCSARVFNNELKEEFKSEMEYIKFEQLELFCTDDKYEKVNFYLDEKDGFEIDENWNPIVSEKEVLEFSKENCWDDEVE